MASGGARQGAGRKASPDKGVLIGWRISPHAREWITRQAEEQGVSTRVIIDELIKSFEKNAEQDAYEALILASLED